MGDFPRRRESQDRLRSLARAEPDAEGRLVLVRSDPHRFTTMVGHDQPKRRAQGAELLQPIQAETLDCRDQGARTPSRITHAESSPLPELEESSFRFVRHSVRWYRWASVSPEPGVVGWLAAPQFVPEAGSWAIGRMMRPWDSG